MSDPTAALLLELRSVYSEVHRCYHGKRPTYSLTLEVHSVLSRAITAIESGNREAFVAGFNLGFEAGEDYEHNAGRKPLAAEAYRAWLDEKAAGGGA